jgi:hypothetical protein
MKRSVVEINVGDFSAFFHSLSYQRESDKAECEES